MFIKKTLGVTAPIFLFVGLTKVFYTVKPPEIPIENKTASEDLAERMANLDEVYYLDPSLETPLLKGSKSLTKGVRDQLKFVKRQRRREFNIGQLHFSKDDLQSTAEEVLAWTKDNKRPLLDELNAYLLTGHDKKGSIKFTGYFTPEIKVKKTPDAVYKYPIYKKPDHWTGRYPTRKQIEKEGALKGKGLEIAYAASRLDVYFMQVQGSGIAEFVDTKERFLMKFGGTNKRRFRSIERAIKSNKNIELTDLSIRGIKKYVQEHPDMEETILFADPSYTFFDLKKSAVKGAAHLPLIPMHSIAVDPKIIPLGSILLAEVPVLDKKRHFSHNEYRLLLAQDVGGAIKGAGHVDLYTGVGSRGLWRASNMKHTGKIWLLLPKKQIAANQKLPKKSDKLNFG